MTQIAAEYLLLRRYRNSKNEDLAVLLANGQMRQDRSAEITVYRHHTCSQAAADIMRHFGPVRGSAARCFPSSLAASGSVEISMIDMFQSKIHNPLLFVLLTIKRT